ncbi:heterotrimeric G-protein [Lithospermum erythrorhizon]|uniref:Heterotrimeric G-protein n=1 Tax=Lithospermum erythrorhizon TaxID=34254 RepID=A0AAV3QGP8_LITER
MTIVDKKMLPVSSSDDLDDYNVEYSFALEYKGPPVSYDLPNVNPVDVDRLPTARILAKVSDFSDLSVPVIQPIVRRGHFKKKSTKDSNLAREVAEALDSVEDLYPFSDFDDAKDGNCREGVDNMEDDDGSKSRVTDENGSWGTLGFSNSRDDSNEVSGSSDVEDLIVGDEESVGFADVSPGDQLTCENSNVRTAALSSEITEYEGDRNHFDEAALEADRSPVVTFLDVPSSRDSTYETSHYDAPEYIPDRPIARVGVKKGACYRCLKGNRFTDKEDCLVCGAKYCRNCIIRAMGSMPEGRKCILCIGFEICESRRKSLGRCSRMLKKLLMESEIERILKAEVSCKVNQLPSYLICVNGKQLSDDELFKLQTCENPPRKLKLGNYWYDKAAGFWGKEGQPPTQIIAPELAVGSQLRREASNGKSGVLINNREITKQECWMLQFVGIRCEENTSYWVSADGACIIEGMKNVIGNIWGKTGVKLLCSALSLPVPPEARNSQSGVDGGTIKINPKTLNQDMQYKLLLVGLGQSGTSTIFKQVKILHNVPFTEDERQNIKFMIQRNLYSYVAILLEARERFEDEYLNEMKLLTEQPSSSEISVVIDEDNLYSIAPRLKLFSDWLLQVNMSGNLEAIFPASTREYAPVIEELWKDKAFQATYRRRAELDKLPRVANYFLDRAVEISKVNYEPSDMDILYAEGISSTNGVASMEFSFPKTSQENYTDHVDQDDSFRRFQLTRVNARSLGENCKWLEMFEDVDVILFCVSLTDYDEFYENGDGTYTNKMLAARKLFESVVKHSTFSRKQCLLILNKFDMLEEKIEKVPLTVCDWFEDFNPVISHHSNRTRNNSPSLAQRAFHYIAVKFKILYKASTGHKLYVSCVTGLEVDSVDDTLKYVREILRWEEERQPVSMTEWSVNSPETSTIL